MFNFLKKNKTETIFNLVDGKVISLPKVSDPVFSQKMMGEGFGVVPEANQVFSPVKGKITTIFATKHAFGLKTKSGLEVLVHIGLDTVEMNGIPFNVHVSEGQEVDEQTLLATVNFSEIEAAGKETTVLVIFTNGLAVMKEIKDPIEQQAIHGEVLLELPLK